MSQLSQDCEELLELAFLNDLKGIRSRRATTLPPHELKDTYERLRGLEREISELIRPTYLRLLRKEHYYEKHH